MSAYLGESGEVRVNTTDSAGKKKYGNVEIDKNFNFLG